MRAPQVGLAALAIALGACATGDPVGPESPPDDTWRYRIRVTENATEAVVVAAFPDSGYREFLADPDVAPTLNSMFYWRRGQWRRMEGESASGHLFLLPRGAPSAPRLRYRVDLRRALETGAATERGGVLRLGPRALCLAPRGGVAPTVELEIETPDEVELAAGLFPAPGAPGAFALPSWQLRHAPDLALGDLEVHTFDVADSEVQVAFDPAAAAYRTEPILEWIEEAAHQVAGYVGRFPVPRLLVYLYGGSGVATTYGSGCAVIEVPLERFRTVDDLEDDWIMAHEMVHLALPNVHGEHRWIEEGLATYVEPVARARAGDIAPERLWLEMVECLPQGQPRAGDRGLDGTSTWARTYWGGALFWFVADVELRRRTGGALGVEHVLRLVADNGGHQAVTWSLDELLGTVAGPPVLRELYEAHRATALEVDLDAYWRALGVSVERGRVRLDDGAPEAAIRRAIESGG